MSEAHSAPASKTSHAGQAPAEAEVTQDFAGNAARATRLVEILDQYLAALKAGQAPDRARLLADHPDLAAELERYLDGMEFLHANTEAASPGKRLGDFRIVREIGQGGMGAVYEAEQISLHRRVALKVLRFGRVSDPEALERFQREAETVACLHHTNIVPIFAVGSEAGVNYYAMQFILGRSLDRVLKDEGRPINPQKVAKWGLEAAEALAHAHARGVIHRDVKPSNLLLDDAEGRIWLTDFGLAKRLDDVTLSMTGALLGTPRYMSPEQASASTRLLDHRTDIYSLGASLYELATGKPVFVGDSPHNVISQILTDEPVPPRRQNPAIPRDLETILTKCLAKDATQRYTTAQRLADDLRAFLEGRPIAARRSSLVEQGVRWVRRQQRSLVLTGAAVLATLLLIAVGAASAYFWQHSRLAYLRLESARPPLVAQLLDPEGKPAAPKATVPMQQAAEVPAGEYRLRLSSEERLSQEYDVSLEPGQQINQAIDLEDQLLWGDLQYRRAYRTIRIVHTSSSERSEESFVPAFKTDLLLLDNESVQRIDGRDRNVVWELNLAQPKEELLTQKVRLVWPWDRNGQSSLDGVGVFDSRPFVVSASAQAASSFDFNDDGVSDVVIAARHQAWVLALSGKDGAPLWIAARGDAVSDGQSGQLPVFGVQSGVPYQPLVISDQNGDGIADLAVWYLEHMRETGTVGRWLELISGKTGATLWKYQPPAEFFALDASEEIPSSYRWFYGASGGYSSGGRGSIWSGRRTRRGLNDHLARHGETHYLPSDVFLADSTFAFIAGSRLVQLDCATGQATLPPQDLPVRPSTLPRWADFDGDHKPDVLFTTVLPNKPPAKPGGTGAPQLQLTAWSTTRQMPLWHTTVEAIPPTQQEMHVEAPLWPFVEDLDGDGRSEVLVPDGSSLSTPDWFGSPWGYVAALDGKTGQSRWRRPLMNVDQQLDTFVSGPDVNGDGFRDVYVASLWGQYYELYVDCISGKDGQTLLRTQLPTQPEKQSSGSHRLAPLIWYSQSNATLPQLVVRLLGNQSPSYVCLFSDSGKLNHVASQVFTAEPGDFDGDGVDDLLLDRPDNINLIGKGGRLHIFRGTLRETARRLAMYEQPLADFNEDGVADIVRTDRDQRISAVCGLTGKRLWTTAAAFRAKAYAPRPVEPQPSPVPQAEDLNGDGVPDLLLLRVAHELRKAPVVTAISGKSGRTLWQSELATQMVGMAPLLESRDLDGDGELEIILVAGLDLGRPVRQGWSSSDMNLRLAVMSGKTGKTRFTHELIETTVGNPTIQIGQAWLESSYSDLDGDGTLDLLLPGKTSASSKVLEMRALSGKDGRTLWRQDLAASQRNDALAECIPPAARVINGDGLSEVIVAALAEMPDDQGQVTTQMRLTCVQGKTGAKLWEQAFPTERYYSVVQNDHQVPNRVRPLLVRRTNKQWIAILTRRFDRHHLRLIDEEGKLVSEKTLAAESIQHEFRLWACDVDGDEQDELVFYDNGRMCVAPADNLNQPLWTSQKNEWSGGAMKGILRTSTGPQFVLQGRTGAPHSLYGLSAASGALCWMVVGPRVSGETPGTLLRSLPEASPLAYFPFHGVTIVRQGTVLNGGEHALRTVTRPGLEFVASVPPDPRLLRPLPWAPQDLPAIPRFIAWSAFYGLVLVGIPTLYLQHLIRRKQWGLKVMLLLPVVAGIFLMGVTINGPENDFQTLSNKLLVAAVMAGPAMFALYHLARWIILGRWSLLCLWLTIGMALAAAVGIAALRSDYREGPFQPGERFSWEGWYWILGPGYYLMAWLMTITLPLWWLGRFAWPRLRRSKVASA